MKILYIDPFPTPGSLGGSHRSLLDIMIEMKKLGDEVIFASSNTGELTKEALKRDIKVHLFNIPKFLTTNVRIFGRKYFSYFATITIIFSMLVTVFQLLKIIRENKPTIVHCNEALFSIPVGVSCLLARVRSIGHVRWVPSDSTPDFIIKCYSLLVSCSNEVVLFNSQETATPFRRNQNSSKFRVLYNGIKEREVNKDELNSLTKTIGLERKMKTIGIFGRIIPMKGHHVLLKSAKYLSERGIKLNILILGDNSDKNYLSALEEKIKEYELCNIHMLGFKNDIENYLSISDIIVAPSTVHESFGRTLIEGMALGKTVIASNVGAHPEIIEDGINGFLVEPNNPKDLADKIEELIGSDELLKSIGGKGRACFLSRFSLGRMISDLNSIYDEVLKV